MGRYRMERSVTARARAVKLKFHGTVFLAASSRRPREDVTRMLRRCCGDARKTGPVEFQLDSARARGVGSYDRRLDGSLKANEDVHSGADRPRDDDQGPGSPSSEVFDAGAGGQTVGMAADQTAATTTTTTTTLLLLDTVVFKQRPNSFLADGFPRDSPRPRSECSHAQSI